MADCARLETDLKERSEKVGVLTGRLDSSEGKCRELDAALAKN
jgi:hypothetical protein